MFHIRKTLPVVLLLLTLACNALAPSAPATPRPAATAAQAVADTSTPVPADTATAAPADTDTPAPAPSDTVPAAPTISPADATLAASMGAMGFMMGGNIDQYANPVGAPLKTWNGVPIMPQATAGQEFAANVYGYNAAVTLEQARQFYQGKSASLGLMTAPGTGFGGTGSHAYHSVNFLSFKLVIILSSHDDDPKQVNVVISTAP